MNLIKNYTEFKVKAICHRWGIKNWSINSNGLVDVDRDVNLSYKNLTKLPLKFGTISGHFYCNYNQLTSLDGAPKIVRGDFWCVNNQLTSLEYSPKTVTGGFICNWNQIKSFEGAPMYVDRDFLCVGNPICPIWCLFYDWSKVEFLNDCDAIQDNNIIMDRLNYFLVEIGKGECDEWAIGELKKYGYKIIY